MNTEQIKLLTWKLNGMNLKIQERIIELDKLVSEREKIEDDLEKLNNPGYKTQNND